MILKLKVFIGNTNNYSLGFIIAQENFFVIVQSEILHIHYKNEERYKLV